MRFSRLRLTGFKSFVDPTDLLISTGLTGVVGPNGCGKSNLLEALRWVMGENRPTAMRGGGMEDVIFAGAATRAARSFAEVQLQIDNSDRLAPSGFNDSDQLEVVRRITRDAGSAYKVNGREVRARDVQMLFADAATGSQSPALVRQGQISELINARPKARRRILEDAAGIGGLYQRRHEAELKLKTTETNLTRVDDVIEGLAAQLATLTRQARQAARYRAIGAELRQAEGLLLYRRWTDAEAAHQSAAADLRKAAAAVARAEAQAEAAGTARDAAERALPPLREEESIAAAVLHRAAADRDALDEDARRAEAAIATLRARIEQLTRDLERESALDRDAGDTLRQLEDELATLDAESEGQDARLAETAESAQDAAEILSDRESQLALHTEDMARLSAQHHSAERALGDLRATLARSQSAEQAARDAARQAADAMTATDRIQTEATDREAAAQDLVAAAEDRLTEAEAARTEAQAEEAEARALLSEAEGEVSALGAEVTALTRLLERDRSADGQIMDAIQVASGFEKALGAALADDLRAPETDSTGITGWAELAPYDAPPALPQGVDPLARHVSAPRALARRLGQIGVIDPESGPALHAGLAPGQRLVSRDGDLWRWDGFRSRAADMPSAAALRFEQRNRLETLRREAERARAARDTALDGHAARQARLAELTRLDRDARDARRDAERAATEAARAARRAEAERSVADGRLETAQLAVARHAEDAAAARAALAEAETQRAELPDIEAARAEVEDIRITVEAARMTMMARRSAHDEARRTGEARSRRAAQVTRDLANWRTRLATAQTRRAELADRRDAAEDDLGAALARPEALARQRERLDAQIAEAETRSTTAAQARSAGEAALAAAVQTEREAATAASDAREIRARDAARAEAAAQTRAAAAARIAEEQDTTPHDLARALNLAETPLPDADAVEAQVETLKRQRDALGAVNLRAEEDARAVAEEHDQLATEKADLEEAVRTLRTGIAGLNREGRERLLAAFEQVNTNFSMLFRHLFNGGEANLVMVESDDPLEAGLEILCQPPGKKLSTLSLLSGGEQTLTALALIFGVFLANPAPICVLDEVDAPLDDANVTRFCDMLDEMCRRTDTRFLIITHHAVTMARMDRLFGVTMQEQGVSQLVSVDLKRAEKLVA